MMAEEGEAVSMSEVVDALVPAMHHAGEFPTVDRYENVHPDIKYLLSKREPIFPPYIRSLIRSFGEDSVLEALRRMDGRSVSNAFLGGVCRHIAEGT